MKFANEGGGGWGGGGGGHPIEVRQNNQDLYQLCITGDQIPNIVKNITNVQKISH